MIGENIDVATARVGDLLHPPVTSELHRSLDWKGAFWASSGVPAGILMTVGGIASIIGQPSWLVWIVSSSMGFIQAYVYAEIAGLYPHKSGGASVYGAAAWLPYSKFIAPISVWSNWLAWSPVLALGTSLAAAYVLSSLFPPNAVINTWQIELFQLGFISQGLMLRINAVSIIGTCFLLLTFALQHQGAARAAYVQKILGVACLSPLVLVGLIPIITGDMPSDHLLPLLPLIRDAAGHAHFGAWDAYGVTLLMGAMFGASYTTYAFETAVCYTREFQNPARDTGRAIIASGLLAIAVFTLVPLAFQSSLGLDALLDPRIYDGTGVALALARIVGGGVIITNIFIVTLILALLLVVMTSMMGSSRTLYQASVDGWLPRYLSKVNEHGAPTAAMWTDLIFNMILLLTSNYFTILIVSNVCYIIFTFFNLQAGWIHRIDRPSWDRPFRCPTILLGTGALFGFVNLIFMGAGADVWGQGTLRNGLIGVLLIIPVFIFRHYIQDKGVFPFKPEDARSLDENSARRAGALPWVTLVIAVLVIGISHYLSQPVRQL